MSSAVIRAAGNTLKYLLSPAARDKVVHSLGNEMIHGHIQTSRETTSRWFKVQIIQFDPTWRLGSFPRMPEKEYVMSSVTSGRRKLPHPVRAPLFFLQQKQKQQKSLKHAGRSEIPPSTQAADVTLTDLKVAL